ncbi:hypothetical protein TcWFU_006619 [Taenia crassiceps]|uniref:Uncharacterized protein n=1 Tax=Taenia crassiceps TaxID=6207 RepID=A0ABR4QRS4_9CEST
MASGNSQIFGAKHRPAFSKRAVDEVNQSPRENSPSGAVPADENLSPPYLKSFPSRTINACKCEPKKKNQSSFLPLFECDETAECSGLSCSQFSGDNFTDFSKESFLTRLSDVAKKVKSKKYFAQRIAECGLVTTLTAPNEVKYIPRYRLAPQGVDWPECVHNKNIIRRPLFILLQSNELLSKVDAASPSLFTAAYLFDAILNCRLSEKFYLENKMTGVFRVTDRWRELSKILLANEDDNRNEASTTSLHKEVGSYLKGVYLIIEVSKRLQTQSTSARNADLIPTGSKSTGTSAVSNTKTDDAPEGACLLTPFAWNAVDLSTAVSQICQEALKSPRRRHFSASERYLSADHREGQGQRMSEAFRRPRLLSDASDALKRPPRSRTVSNDRRFSAYASESSSNDLQVCEVAIEGSNLLPLEDPSPLWRLGTNKLKNAPNFVELNLQLTTRTFIKKDLTTGGHFSEIERTIMEAFKLQSSTPNMSPWVHDIPTRVGHGHPLRRTKTFVGQLEVSMTGKIVSPYGLSHYLQNANFCSTEGESLLTRSHSETMLQEVVEFPTIGRVFPFNFPRNLLYVYPQSVTFGMSKSVSRNIEIVIQLWCSDASGRHTIPAFPSVTTPIALKNEARTRVILKNRSPDFTDEIKVVLPKVLNSGHYLLFTFVHVELSPSRDITESVLGYSWLPVLVNGEVLSGEEMLYLIHDHPTSKMIQTMPRHVEGLTKDDVETDRTYALDKTSFHLHVVPVSSLYQNDENVSSIIRNCGFTNISETIGSLSGQNLFLTQSDSDFPSSLPPLLLHLQKAKLNQLVLYLAPIMDGLLQALGVCLIQNKAKPSQNLLTLLAFYIHRMSKALSDWKEEFTGRNHFICAFLSGVGRCPIDHVLPYLLSGYPMLGLAWIDDVHEYLHGSIEKVTKKLHEELLQCLIVQIATDTPFFRNFYEETLWFFLELLVRTLIIECKLNEEPASELFVEKLNVLTREITKSISTRLKLDDKEEAFDSTRLVNCALAFFLLDLLTSLNITHVFRFISTYIQAINSAIDELLEPGSQNLENELAASAQTKRIRNLELIKLEMLQIVTASPDYLVLSLPDPKFLPDGVHLINQEAYFAVSKHEGKILTDSNYQRLHFLPALLLREIQTCLLHSDPTLQTNALTTLWYLMKSHESQPCICGAEREPPSLCDVAALYIPLLEIACDHASAMYTSWIGTLEKQERVFREAAKVSMLLDTQRSANDGASKRFGWILSSMTTKERVRWMGRRISLTPDRRGSVEYRPSSALPIPSHQEYPTFHTSTKTWIHTLLPPTPSTTPSEPTCAFSDCATRLLLLETLWILHYNDQRIVQRWLVIGSVERARNLVDLLILALNYFEYPSEKEFLTGSTDDCPKDPQKLEEPPILSLKRLDNLGSSHPADTAPFTCRGKAKHLFLFVTSVVCKTLDLLISAFDHPLSASDLTDEESDNMIGSSHLIYSIARAYIFGLSMHHCSKTFQLLACGLSELISQFPQYFLDKASVTHFVLCRVLLPHCASPLKKIRKIANATAFHLFQQCHRVRNHLYPANGQMALALHSHLTSNDLILDTSPSFSWFTRRLGVVTECLSYLTEPSTNLDWHHLLSHLIYDRRVHGNQEGDPLFPTLAPPDVRLLLAKAHFPACFRALKEYAKADSMEGGDLGSNGHIGGVSSSGLRFAIELVDAQAPDAGFQTQLNASVDVLHDIFACLLRFNDLQRCPIGSQIVEKEDQISVVELLVDLASACRLLPELRQYWLLRLAEVHLFFKQPAEAAQALLHTLAIDVEQMVSRKSSSLFTVLSEGADFMARQLGSPNLLEESALELAVGLPASASLPLTAECFPQKTCATVVVKRFYELIERIAKCFHAADQFEVIPSLCYWILPILYSTGEQECLHQVHELIRTSNIAVNEHALTHRLFSTYFRVGFYGSLFGDQNGKEFIYKEAPFIKLAEITARLQEFYSHQFGGKPVVVLKSSSRVVVTDLDESSAYLQITYVEPYFEEFELRKRRSEYERNYGIKRFVMVTPFTQAGPAHGSISKQYKRKAILTTSRCFPYLNLRLPIINYEELVLSPIEVAIEDVAKRNQQLALAIHTDPPNAKFLQMVLQGCVSATVNQGPLEVAVAFLTKQNSPSSPASNENTIVMAAESTEEQRNDLRLCLKEFLRRSQEAVRMNRQLIGQDQEEYQRELERNFVQIKLQMEPFLKLPRSHLDWITA